MTVLDLVEDPALVRVVEVERLGSSQIRIV